MRTKLELWQLVQIEFEDKFVKDPAFYGGLCVLLDHVLESYDLITQDERDLLDAEIWGDISIKYNLEDDAVYLFPRKEIESRRQYINDKIKKYESE